jgi:biotin transport system substrate-specific component
MLGRPAVLAYILMIGQTILGAPFFSNFEGGVVKLFGPTGGYIFGFALSMLFLALTRNYKPNLYLTTFLKITIAHIILYSCGLFHLSRFVPKEQVFLLGLYPFVFGAILKTGIIIYVVTKKN